MTVSCPIEVGAAAPDFSLVTQNGDRVGLGELRGRKSVLLVFYPFAFSGICTGELSEIRDHLEDFEGEDIAVFAISCDPMFSLRGWADQQAYFFPLLSDFWPHGQVARAYGVFDEEHGRPLRGTFLIDPQGIVRWRLVNGPGERRDFDEYRLALADLRGAPAKS
jgi:peroxiredoxin (alkyl hydroperoxide reductase subunit C)